jgi:hypothetical protein
VAASKSQPYGPPRPVRGIALPFYLNGTVGLSNEHLPSAMGHIVYTGPFQAQGPTLKGIDRDQAPPQQHEQEGWDLPEEIMEASHPLPEGQEDILIKDKLNTSP